MTRFDATDRRPVDKWTAAPRPTTSPQGQKPQQKRSTHMVHKPVNSECSRQRFVLANIGDRTRFHVRALEDLEQIRFAGFAQRRFQNRGNVKVILQRAFAARG